MQEANVFISYAKDDYKIVETIINNCFNFPSFQSNKIKYKVKFEWDKHIDPGEYWEKEIIWKIKSADVIICMLSQNFFKSDYILQKELPLALSRRKEVGISVLGVLIQDCDFSIVELNKFQIIPQKNARLKPVSEWRSKKECWGAIKSGIKICIENSIERLPDPLKYRSDLSPKNKAIYRKHFVNPHYLKLENKYKKRRPKSTKSQKKPIVKYLRNVIIFLSIILLMILLRIIFLS